MIVLGGLAVNVLKPDVVFPWAWLMDVGILRFGCCVTRRFCCLIAVFGLPVGGFCGLLVVDGGFLCLFQGVVVVGVLMWFLWLVGSDAGVWRGFLGLLCDVGCLSLVGFIASWCCLCDCCFSVFGLSAWLLRFAVGLV